MRLDDILCDKRFYEDPGVYLIEIEAIFEVIDPQNLRSTSTAALPLSGCLAIEGISFMGQPLTFANQADVLRYFSHLYRYSCTQVDFRTMSSISIVYSQSTIVESENIEVVVQVESQGFWHDLLCVFVDL